MKLNEQKVLITGGSSGIGLAMATALVARGNQVMICGRDPERLKTATQALGKNAYCFQADLAQEEDLRALLDAARTRMDGLSLLINNGGIQFNYQYDQVPTSDALRQTDEEIMTNLTGLIKLTALSLPLLREAEEAAVVNLSSGLAFVPKQSAPVYSATKAGVHAFTKALRHQLESGPKPIRVFEAIPPLVDTAMTTGRGKGKMTPAQCADEILRGVEADRREIRVGLIRVLLPLNRFAPHLAERIMRRS